MRCSVCVGPRRRALRKPLQVYGWTEGHKVLTGQTRLGQGSHKRACPVCRAKALPQRSPHKWAHLLLGLLDLEIDGDVSTGLVAGPEEACDPEPIVLEASAPGMAPVKIDIPTSVDADADGVFNTAEASAGLPVVVN